VLDLEQELRAVIEAFDDAAIPYALCGGLALAVHGQTRATSEFDLLIPASSLPAAAGVVASLGYAMDLQADSSPITHRQSKIDADGNSSMLDIVLLTPPDDVWADREEFVWQGRTISVIARDDLVQLKRGSAVNVDMSSNAVTTRLQRASQLRKLCLSLMKAKPVPPKAKA
jgi:hypothetical protein